MRKFWTARLSGTLAGFASNWRYNCRQESRSGLLRPKAQRLSAVRVFKSSGTGWRMISWKNASPPRTRTAPFHYWSVVRVDPLDFLLQRPPFPDLLRRARSEDRSGIIQNEGKGGLGLIN